jgi:KipI family sensor histidine kinase inhibitor
VTSEHRVRPYGPRGVLVTPGGGVRPAALASVVAGWDGVAEVVPAAETVLVVLRSRDSLAEVANVIARLDVEVIGAGGESAAARDEVVIDVVYDGEDLGAVADASELSIADVVALHSGGTYSCDFCGFAPGFAYLSGLDPRLVLPRRATPRTSVPAGSVAIAGPYTAVYPSTSPGGWHLLGRADAVLWDVTADPPSRITPGTRVKFRPVTESGRRQSRNPGRSTPGIPNGTHDTQIRVIRAGISTSFQDRGRPGYAALGLPRSGAVDGTARDLVNRLVGNPADAAVVETAGGLAVEATAPVVVADSATGAVRTLAAGEQLMVDPAVGELYGYLSVRGGFDVEPVLGSRSWDSLSRLGPSFPGPGSGLRVGADPGTDLATDLAPHALRSRAIRLWAGPRLDWFVDGAFERLLGAVWTVTGDVSRVGVRLSGPALSRHAERGGELPSEGLVSGAIQVPPDGQPVVMLSDHPTTGGYPVIGVVDDRDLAAIAQARPGSTVSFRRAAQP